MVKHKAKTAVIWSGADIFLRHGLQFGISIVLARLLSPDEFGTIALMLLFTGIANTFVDGGFSTALIQRQDISHTDESTVFWFNLAMGATMAVALLAVAPAIASFYSRSILEPLTAVMAANVFFSALGSIHATLLTRRLDFRTQLVIGVIATLVSGLVAIGMALKGFGVWALAIQVLIASMVSSALLWLGNSWRPAWIFSRASVRKLFGFGGYLMTSALLEIFYSRFYTILIGRFYGVTALGLYERADSTIHLPIGALSGVFSRVALPLFSSVAKDINELRRRVQFSVRSVMLLNVPAMLGLAVVAEPLVLTLFGKQWLPAVEILQVLCLGGALWPLHVINLNALIAQGHSHLFFRLEVIKKLLGVVLLVMGAFFGVIGVAWAQVAFGILAFAVNAHYSKKFLRYGVAAQIWDCLPALAQALLMGAGLYIVNHLFEMTPAEQLGASIGVGILSFSTLIFTAKRLIPKGSHGFLNR